MTPSWLTFPIAVQLAASALTIVSSWSYGNKTLRGPIFGLISQVPWWSIMVMGNLWGLLPVNLMMVCTHTRNLYKWWKEANANALHDM